MSFEGESGVLWSYDPGARIGDQSGFGQVFRGTGQAGQAIAVKRVPLRWGADSERRRREREVDIDRVLAGTSAKHVMRLLDVGRVGDDLLLVMPMADRSLAAAIQAGDLDDLARLEAMRQVAQGLAELAEIPLLHRDLKPANVLDFQGVWKLADFGISRNLLESTDTYTFRGWGTWPYMAPELWAGQPATVKTELYALGVLAFEVLTGARPFTGADEAALRRQHEHEPPPALPAGVPATVGRLVLRLLAKDPAVRPQDARAVVEALDAAVRRLSPRLEALREVAFAAQRRHSVEDAASAAKAARKEAGKQQTVQALADLQAVLEEAAAQAWEALPEVELTRRDLPLTFHYIWQLGWGGRSLLLVDIWPDLTLVQDPSDDDPLLLAGVVAVAESRYYDPDGSNDLYANVVCEMREGRLSWSLLRFTASPRTGRYEYGPQDRAHGLGRWDFDEQRPHMLHPGMHVWQMQQAPLTAETVVDLLHVAISRS